MGCTDTIYSTIKSRKFFSTRNNRQQTRESINEQEEINTLKAELKDIRIGHDSSTFRKQLEEKAKHK